MPTQEHLIQVARSVKRDLDREKRSHRSYDRRDLTELLRRVSGEPTTRIKAMKGAELERALSDQGLRCYPGLSETSTDDRIRIFRAGSAVGDLIDAVLVPSRAHDQVLGDTVTKMKGTGEPGQGGADEREVESAAEILRRVLPAEKQLEYVRSLHDPELATT